MDNNFEKRWDFCFVSHIFAQKLWVVLDHGNSYIFPAAVNHFLQLQRKK